MIAALVHQLRRPTSWASAADWPASFDVLAVSHCIGHGWIAHVKHRSGSGEGLMLARSAAEAVARRLLGSLIA